MKKPRNKTPSQSFSPAKARTFRPRADNLAIGITIFAIGLFTKVLIADSEVPPGLVLAKIRWASR